MAEEFLSDEEILTRISAFESAGFPPDECIEYAAALAKYCPGDVAEGAIRSLVENFPDDRLHELVRKHVAPSLGPDIEYCQGLRANILAYALVDRGFNVRSGWRVSWFGGDALEGENLCRLALLAVWLRGDAVLKPSEVLEGS